jgi:hypothetical protein
MLLLPGSPARSSERLLGAAILDLQMPVYGFILSPNPLTVAAKTGPSYLFRMTRLFGSLSLGQKDFLRVVGMGLGFLPSALIPNRFDPWIIDKLTGLAVRLRPGKLEGFAEKMSRTLGPRGEVPDLMEEARSHFQMTLEGPWARVRSLHKGGWKPQTTVDGLERIREGLAEGAGTILWRMSFGSTLAVKAGLWKAGIPLLHLSLWDHGSWSGTWVTRRALCPLYVRTEKWYLDERVIIPFRGTRAGVMRILLRRLREDNAVVSIIGENRGTKDITTPFFDGRAHFATGAPSLAWKAGSALLPVYTVREGTGRYRIVIDEPIEVDRDLDRNTYVEKAVGEFSERMQGAIARHPGSWAEWGKFWTRGSIFLDAAEDTPQEAPPS